MERPDSRSDADICPRLTEVAERRSVAGKYEVIRLLAQDESRQQFADACRHVGFPRLAVLAGFERDCIREQVYLSAPHGSQLAQAETEGVRGFEQCPKPKPDLGTLVCQTCVHCLVYAQKRVYHPRTFWRPVCIAALRCSSRRS